MTKVHGPHPTRRQNLTTTLILLRRAARELVVNDPLRLGAFTAVFATFALPPIILILVQPLESVYFTSAVRAMLLSKLSNLPGSSASELINQILQNVTNVERSRLVTYETERLRGNKEAKPLYAGAVTLAVRDFTEKVHDFRVVVVTFSFQLLLYRRIFTGCYLLLNPSLLRSILLVASSRNTMATTASGPCRKTSSRVS